ncbi:Uu.00g067420.m01.CDS01 [Anthostomella pinea]|uniref:Uu.00g067420.m01.CDS01 n=1 Tax=Anthostomella pinea TaxID=933095 RepID=A0AAI8YKZ3_9PEZI|nr:Uu.00g067420.m01.CDS01 [Anthostomella pinea]
MFLAAAQGGHEGIVQHLLEKGVNIDAKDQEGHGALAFAASGGPESLVRLLLENGADANSGVCDWGNPPLAAAAYQGKESIIRLLLAHGADVEGVDKRGNTPLMRAIFPGREDALRLLLAHGANVNAVDNLWKHAAVGRRIMRLLLARGADVNVTNQFGHTPVTNAARVGAESIVRLLLKHGAHITGGKDDERAKARSLQAKFELEEKQRQELATDKAS